MALSQGGDGQEAGSTRQIEDPLSSLPPWTKLC